MPNAKLHRRAGMIAGAGNALARSYDLGLLRASAETAGGILGGWVGGALPDLLEPATTPRHRGPLHSWTAGVGLVTGANEAVIIGQKWCRHQAAECWRRHEAASGFVVALAFGVLALLLHFVAGFLAGLQGGYVSHLALDALTPAGLPVLAGS